MVSIETTHGNQHGSQHKITNMVPVVSIESTTHRNQHGSHGSQHRINNP